LVPTSDPRSPGFWDTHARRHGSGRGAIGRPRHRKGGGYRLPSWECVQRRTGLDQPGTEDPKEAMPTTGAFIGVPPIDPSKGALPNENTPPSVAANQ
jgi:hypothetical protein